MVNPKQNAGEAFFSEERSKNLYLYRYTKTRFSFNQTFFLMAVIPSVYFIGVIGCTFLETFVLEVALEELQAHQGKYTQAEDGEDGHISQLPH